MNNEKTIAYLLLLVLNISFINIAYSLSASNNSLQSLESLQETVTALDVTRSKSQIRLQNLKSMQNMTHNKEVREYQIFIEYLSYQIFEYCQKIIEQFGSQAITNLPCENFGNSLLNTQSKKMNESKTPEQELSSLENELMESLGEFDEMLLQEDEQLAQVTRKAGNSSRSSKNSGKSQSGSETSGQHSREHSEKEQENKTEQSGNKNGTEGQYEQEPGGKQRSENSGSGRGKQKTSGKYQSKERRRLDEIDDDIVARQLKEAAEKETDPDLKEKLWDEYYRYKKKTLAR